MEGESPTAIEYHDSLIERANSIQSFDNVPSRVQLALLINETLTRYAVGWGKIVPNQVGIMQAKLSVEYEKYRSSIANSIPSRQAQIEHDSYAMRTDYVNNLELLIRMLRQHLTQG